MRYETNASKIDILKCLKTNLTKTGRSMVMVKADNSPKKYVIYVMDGFLKPEDKERIKEDLNCFEIPYRERCIASIRMIFGSPYEVEFNWALDFKKCQSAMVCISDAMVLTEYMPRKEPLAEDEFSKGVFKVPLQDVMEMELFKPFEKYTDEEKAAIVDIQKPEKQVKKAPTRTKVNKSGTTVINPGKISVLQYQYKRKNKNGRKKSTRATHR